MIQSNKDAKIGFAKDGLSFAKGLDLAISEVGEYYKLATVSDSEAMVVCSDKPIKIGNDEFNIYSILGTVEAPDGSTKDFTEVKTSSFGQIGGIGCTDSTTIENLQPDQTLYFSVGMSKKGSKFASFVPEAVALENVAPEGVKDEEVEEVETVA